MTVWGSKSIILIFFFFGSQLGAHRDPFNLYQKRKQSKNAGRLVRLVGLISYQNTYGAIVALNKKQHVVFKGSVVNGYMIKDIFTSGITMERGGKIKKIMIDEVDQ